MLHNLDTKDHLHLCKFQVVEVDNSVHPVRDCPVSL